MKKNVLAILTASVIIVSFLGATILPRAVVAQDPTDWYMTVSGVLDSDYYALYPFEKKSLTIGLSKFGELIDANTKKGLEYDGVDPFASDPYVPEFEWSQGWVINITYAYGGWYRNVWAFALYSDSWGAGSIGGNWKRAPAADSTTVIGGRKYGGWSADGEVIGYVETDPLQVLYNGPRLFVALSRTTIYEDTAKQNPLVRLDLTFVFEKVKKYVIVFKDIKRLDYRKFSSDFQVEFSNRGEWDLGKVETPKSYAHFFDNKTTCYHEGWHTYYPTNASYDVVQIISYDTPGYVGFAAFWPSLISKYVEATKYVTRKTMLTTLETYIAKFSGDGQQTEFPITDPHPKPIGYPRGHGVWRDDPMVFVNGKLQAPNTDYTWDSGNATVTFKVAPPTNASIWFVYKRSVHKVDMSEEPAVPYVIGEWDFDLPNEPNTQFRGITVYGIVNYHDADNNVIDREIEYLLDEVFNPWDLYNAVEKNTMRFVKIATKTVTATTRIDYDVGADAIISKEADKNGQGNPIGTSWYDYCNATERVLVDGVLIPPAETRTAPYYIATKIDNKWYINVTIPAGTHTIKILWSNSTTGRYEWTIVGRDAATVDSAGAALVTAAFKNKQVEIGLAGADMMETTIANAMPWVMHKFGTGNTKADYKDAIGRAALKDDWCTTWPVASSNLIAVGGPLANMLAYYANDFTPAFFGLEEYAASVWDNKIIALSCWSKNTYASNETVGYAVVTTYKDINGTVLFLIWGHWGRDTYYATKWFHEEGIYELQRFPRCATGIILEIDYTVHEPTVSVIEVLGTISETKIAEEGKGGIHPDP
ncbi:MAG: hypothetical protein QXP36_01380 [Conexivisphaerales archaeon]